MEMIVATKNKGKLREFDRILSPLGIEVVGMEALDIHLDIDENGATFCENAKIKAQAIHALTGKPVVADDSGLCVDALGGRPGVYSARYGGEELPYPQKIALLLEELREVPPEERTASFECVIYFVDQNGAGHAFPGSCSGVIGYQCKGDRGFGYDPIFYLGEESFSSLSDEKKDACSHRGKALRAFAQALPGILNQQPTK